VLDLFIVQDFIGVVVVLDQLVLPESIMKKKNLLPVIFVIDVVKKVKKDEGKKTAFR